MKERNQNRENKIVSERNSEALNLIETNEVPRKLTIEQLRKHKGYEGVSEEEAKVIIETLYNLSIIAYFYYVETKK